MYGSFARSHGSRWLVRASCALWCALSLSACGGGGWGTNSYRVGGTLSGLAAGQQVRLLNRGGDSLTLTANGSFTFSQSVAPGSSYAVTVGTQPTNQQCTVANATGVSWGADVSNVAVSCATHYLYGTSSSASTSAVLQYRIAGSGQLVALGITSVPVGTPANGAGGLVVDATGNHVFVASPGGSGTQGSLFEFGIDGSSGQLGALSPPSITVPGSNATPYMLAASPTAGRVYSANFASNTVSQYTIDSGGLLSVANTLPVGIRPAAVAVDPSGRYLYVATSDGPPAHVFQYTIGSDGTLTPMATPSLALAGATPRGIAISPGGQWLYVANFNNGASTGGSVNQFAIGADGALTPMSPASLGVAGAPFSIVIDPTGSYVYATDRTNSAVYQFKVGADGSLAPMTPAAVTGGSLMTPQGIVVDPTGRFVFVANAGSDTISQYAIASDGTLSSLSPATVTGAAGMSFLAVR